MTLPETSDRIGGVYYRATIDNRGTLIVYHVEADTLDDARDVLYTACPWAGSCRVQWEPIDAATVAVGRPERVLR